MYCKRTVQCIPNREGEFGSGARGLASSHEEAARNALEEQVFGSETVQMWRVPTALQIEWYGILFSTGLCVRRCMPSIRICCIEQSTVLYNAVRAQCIVQLRISRHLRRKKKKHTFGARAVATCRAARAAREAEGRQRRPRDRSKALAALAVARPVPARPARGTPRTYSAAALRSPAAAAVVAAAAAPP